MKQFTSQLNEAVMPDVVNDAINNRYRVLVNYDDEENHAVGTRLIEPYALGYTKANNLAVRSYQYNGDTNTSIPKWKLMRLDRIINWKPTKQHFYKQPNENGWKAEDYNNEGDNSMIRIINQVHFDNTSSNDSFSPNDRLNDIRRNIDNIRNSQPIKIDDFNTNNKPIENDIVKDIVNEPPKNMDFNSDEFKQMLNRNLKITDKEKAKRGFKLSNKNEITPQNDINTDNKGPVENDTVTDIIKDNNKIDNNELSDFQKMLNRNLAITDKEKAKRGFSLRK